RRDGGELPDRQAEHGDTTRDHDDERDHPRKDRAVDEETRQHCDDPWVSAWPLRQRIPRGGRCSPELPPALRLRAPASPAIPAWPSAGRRRSRDRPPPG